MQRLSAAGLLLSASACGRTDALWWADSYASDSDTGTEETPGDGDGDDTIGTSTSWSETETDTATSDTTDTWTDTSTDTTETETTETETTDTETTETETTETETETGCMDMPLELTPVPANVLFVIDQGSHMSLQFSGMTRWEAIGQALFGMQAGVAWTWEDSRALGMLSYTSNGGDQGGQCPIAEIVAPTPQNGAAMQLSFAGLLPAQDNPTPDAIDLAVPLFGGEPGHMILLLGRNPDRCSNPSNNGQAAFEAVAAAQAAFQAGVSTYVVEVGDVSGWVAQQVANAGAGENLFFGAAPLWTPNNANALANDLDEILAGLDTCELSLDQPIPPGVEQLCSFDLDGMPLILDDDDGWSLAAADLVQLSGSACEDLAQGAVPTLICDCESLQP